MSISMHNMKNIGPRVDKIMGEYSANADKPRPNGLQRFDIGDQVVYAVNKKNAERKAKLYPDKKYISA